MRHVTRHVMAALVGLALTAGIVYTAESDAFTPPSAASGRCSR